MNNEENNNNLNSNQSMPNTSTNPDIINDSSILVSENNQVKSPESLESLEVNNFSNNSNLSIDNTGNNSILEPNYLNDNKETLQNNVNINPTVEQLGSETSTIDSSNANLNIEPQNNINLNQPIDTLKIESLDDQKSPTASIPIIENFAQEKIIDNPSTIENIDNNSEITDVNQNNNQEIIAPINSEINTSPNQIAELKSPIIETIPDSTIVEKTSNDPTPSPELSKKEEPTQNSEPNPSISNDGLEANDEIFNAVPKPPILSNESKQKKKSNNKIIFLILLIVLIAGIGFGIYYFLVMAKNKTLASSINVKEVKLELGEELSNNIDDYATITGINQENCQLDTKNIDINKVGAYKFNITCANKSVEGTAIVDDTTKPELVLNELTVLPNAVLNVADIVEVCNDASMCIYKFNNESAVNEALKTLGEHEIEISASDEYNNETVVKAKITVSHNAPAKYMTCTVNATENISELSADLTNSYRFGIDSNNNFFNALKSSEFKFDTIDSYNSAKNNYNEATGLHNITGKSTFNEKNKTITLKDNKTLDEIKTELSMNSANNMTTIQMYLTMLGYTCK